MRYLILGAMTLLAAASCSRAEDADTDTAAVAPAAGADSTSERARSAASLADAIAANPAAADSILRAAGYTREGFEALMYEIAADSAMSATFAAAKTR